MTIEKQKVRRMIKDETDKIEALKNKGVGRSPAQTECEHKIEACKILLGK